MLVWATSPAVTLPFVGPFVIISSASSLAKTSFPPSRSDARAEILSLALVILSLQHQIISLVRQALLLATHFRVTVTAARQHLVPWVLQSVPRGLRRVSQAAILRASLWPVIQVGAISLANSLDILDSRKGGGVKI